MLERLQQSKSILVTYLMHLGDLVLTTPFLHVLRKAAPRAHITYLVDAKLQEIVKYNPNIDALLTIDKKGRDNTVKALWNFSRVLQQHQFDFALNIHPNERCSFLAAFSGAKYKVGDSAKVFRPWFDQVITLNRKLHAADMYIDVLTRMGVEDRTHSGLEMVLGKEHTEVTEQFYKEHGVNEDDKLVGFNIGSAVVTKRWEPEKFAALADKLTDAYGVTPIFFGGSMDVEQVNAAVNQMKNKAIVATGRFNLGELASAIKRCKVFITNDSGPMHVAITQQIPVVALYGPSNVKLYGPYTDQCMVVKADPPCAGCIDAMKHRCPTMECMKNITVEQVYAATENFLSKAGEVK